MSHTTQDLQEFIASEARAVEGLEPSRRPAARAYLMGVQDAFEFLTSGRTTLGLADRDLNSHDAVEHRDPNKPARLPKGGEVNTEPANPTIEGEPRDGTQFVNQGNDHTGQKAIDHVKRDLQQAFPERAGDPSRPEGIPAGSREGLPRRK